jgi:plasmid stabilization system protein ParE
MPTRVYWATRAVTNLRGIYEFIAETSPLYAQRTVDRLLVRARQLEDFPESGRTVPELERVDVRELIEGPYRILYHLRSDEAHVLAIIHGRQQFPLG